MSVSHVGQICMRSIRNACIFSVLWLHCYQLLAGWLLRQTNFVRHRRQKSILNFIMRLLGATIHIYRAHNQMSGIVCVCAPHERRDVEVKRWQCPHTMPSWCCCWCCWPWPCPFCHCKKSHKNTNEKLSERLKIFRLYIPFGEEIGQPNAWHLLPIDDICCHYYYIPITLQWIRSWPHRTTSWHQEFICRCGCSLCVCMCVANTTIFRVVCVSILFRFGLVGAHRVAQDSVWCFHCAFGIIS